MVKGLGRYNDLAVIRRSPHGVYLKLEDLEVLLPNKYVPEDIKEGQSIEVFIYKDSEDRLVATTLTPKAILGDYIALEMVAEAQFGAFLDWGLEKHLLVPNAEMADKMIIGQKYVVRIMLDYKTERLIGVAKIDSFLRKIPDNVQEGDVVRGLVYKKTDLGFKVIIDAQYIGLLYHNNIIEPLEIGQSIICYIDKIRDDNKIDLRLKKGGVESIAGDAQRVLKYLEDHEGVSLVTDNADPDKIRETYGLSKKAFKKALGTLYKKRLVVLNPGKIILSS